MQSKPGPVFSLRIPPLLAPSPLAHRLELLREAGDPLLDLTESNPTSAGLSSPESLLQEALTRPGIARYTPDPRGLRQAREAIADYYVARGNVRPALDRIFLTASTSEAYSLLAKLLANPDDVFYVPRPSYPLFEHLLMLEGVRPRYWSSRYSHRWEVELPEGTEVDPRARALIVVNPNNPTGAFLTRDEHRLVQQFCLREHLALISDEVFADYAIPGQAPQRVEHLAESADVLTFSLSGFSKILGLPQLKLGWIVVNGPEDQVQEACARLEFILDQYLSVGTPAQLAAPFLLASRTRFQEPIKRRVAENRVWLLSAAQTCPWITPLRTEGGWYQLLHIPRVDREEAMVEALVEHDHILVHPGYFFDLESEGFVVISLLTPPSVLIPGINRLFARIRHWADG